LKYVLLYLHHQSFSFVTTHDYHYPYHL